MTSATTTTTTTTTRVNPEAFPHGEIKQLFPNIYFVKGGIALVPPTTPLTMKFSRNMTIIVDANAENDDRSTLILVNTVRLDENGLKELDKLGTVKHTMRIGGFHGVDDAFYKERYAGATTWSVEKNYVSAFDFNKDEAPPPPYMMADKILTKDSELPIKDASIHIIESATPKEGLLLLHKRGDEGDKTIAISADSLQNWARSDEHFNLFARFMMWMSGFLKAHNIGVGWYNGAKPKKEDVKSVLDLNFDHVIPGHGEPCIGEATKKYEAAVNALKEQ
jgi:hypothetical protein